MDDMLNVSELCSQSHNNSMFNLFNTELVSLYIGYWTLNNYYYYYYTVISLLITNCKKNAYV